MSIRHVQQGPTHGSSARDLWRAVESDLQSILTPVTIIRSFLIALLQNRLSLSAGMGKHVNIGRPVEKDLSKQTKTSTGPYRALNKPIPRRKR